MARMLVNDSCFGPGGRHCPCCNPLRNVGEKWGRKRCPSKTKQKGRDIVKRNARAREAEATRKEILYGY